MGINKTALGYKEHITFESFAFESNMDKCNHATIYTPKIDELFLKYRLLKLVCLEEKR